MSWTLRAIAASLLLLLLTSTALIGSACERGRLEARVPAVLSTFDMAFVDVRPTYEHSVAVAMADEDDEFEAICIGSAYGNLDGKLGDDTDREQMPAPRAVASDLPVARSHSFPEPHLAPVADISELLLRPPRA